ncbi:MAG: hypothetical protein IKX74_03735 [Erysipelotrichaceae bacterium]|nr:hypothetical protein [Erysipelotrichaceae bacterium]MBO4537661.1 hypothetical protein [Erysipelotrichaceae bacterium]MBR5048736.1 hypothetical protein [Erysipelotrichaceae bacterium]
MKKISKFFPLNDMATDIYHLLAVIIVYLVLGWAAKFVGALTGWLPLLGWLFSLLVWVIRVYCFAGIVVLLLKYFKIVK